MKRVVESPERRAIAETAAQWLIRLDADTPPSREELQALSEWLQRSPAHRAELESLAALWGRMNVLTELAVPLGNHSRSAAHAQFGGGVVRSASTWWRIGLLAASSAVVLALGSVLLTRPPAVDALLASNGLYATAVGQQKASVLADGSHVVLNTNSQIKVDYGGGYRNVYLLQGEALFTVAKDAARPFRVYAGTGRIEALGTAFSVYLNGSDVSVAVTEGRVSLASMKESLGTLDAGQLANIHSSVEAAAEGVSTLETIPLAPEALSQRLAWREGTLMFSGETLEEVARQFSRYTTVSIEIPDPAVRSMRIGGRFPAGETDAMLAALETNFHLRVTRQGHNRVIISAADD